ncbi:Pre-C2HC domain,Zinc finger, CCHC-type [Cinara cedri]|uniref:Pre-C2HC domain,Zinc finger, CCHC-type n=1 Tax=Cinara cedri TaxID=506608 RepID=A0A5E4MMZ0_9HEMI|nr:Pre-C2HC domain,Zinc finger, CCHC-type [Cinara cedri]
MEGMDYVSGHASDENYDVQQKIDIIIKNDDDNAKEEINVIGTEIGDNINDETIVINSDNDEDEADVTSIMINNLNLNDTVIKTKFFFRNKENLFYQKSCIKCSTFSEMNFIYTEFSSCKKNVKKRKNRYNIKQILSNKIHDANLIISIILYNIFCETDNALSALYFPNFSPTTVADPYNQEKKNNLNSPTGTSPNHKHSISTYTSKNRFSPLAQNNDEIQIETDTPINIPQTKLPLPPPIFIEAVIVQFNLFCEPIKQLTQPDGFLCKSSENGLKLNTYTTDSYRKTIKFLKEKKSTFTHINSKVINHIEVVLRHLHHSTPVDTIKEELNSKGFTVRNIINVLHYQTKKTLPLFFVDLEPSPSNKDIFTIDTLVYTKIKIEEPRPRRNLIQCTRCQSYGHSQAYCNHQPRCVKCGDNHLSSECKKDKDSPATCA